MAQNLVFLAGGGHNGGLLGRSKGGKRLLVTLALVGTRAIAKTLLFTRGVEWGPHA